MLILFFLAFLGGDNFYEGRVVRVIAGLIGAGLARPYEGEGRTGWCD